jgi:DNA-binding NarL/FixJ family response regulator
MPITVLLADGNESIRKAIQILLAHALDIHILAQATNFAQTVEFALKLKPQVILLDLHMPDEGLMTVEEVKSKLMGSGLLAISLWYDEETRALAKNMGAMKLLDKARLGTDLISAIRNCVKTGKSDSETK